MKRKKKPFGRMRRITQKQTDTQQETASINYATAFARLMLRSQPGEMFLSTMLADMSAEHNRAKAKAIERAIGELVAHGIRERMFSLEHIEKGQVAPTSQPHEGGILIWLQREERRVSPAKWVGFIIDHENQTAHVECRPHIMEDLINA